MRTYAVKGERGHIVLSYPNGLPEHPMPYWCEVWTGLEYVYALGLVQAGRTTWPKTWSRPLESDFREPGATRSMKPSAVTTTPGHVELGAGRRPDRVRLRRPDGAMTFAAADTADALVLVQRFGVGDG